MKDRRRPAKTALFVFGAAGLTVAFSALGCAGKDRADENTAEPSHPEPGTVVAPGVDPAAPASWDSPLRRLTRSELDRTLSYVFGQNLQVAQALPSDEKAGAFLSNATSAPTQLLVDTWYTTVQAVAAAQAARGQELTGCDAALPACREDFLASFGRRAFRRPLLAEEQSALLSIWESAGASGVTGALARALEAILMAPDFLFHVELGLGKSAIRDEPLAADLPLADSELAARLAYGITGAPPDDALAALAESGGLADTQVLASEVRRLWTAAEAAERLGDFHRGWLGLYGKERVFKDPALYPQFEDPTSIQAALAEEIPRFASHVLQQGGARLGTLLTAPWSYVNEDLAKIYGIDGVVGAELRPFALPPAERGGILTSSAFLAAHAHAGSSNPVARGVVVLRHVLCTPLGDPPPGVDTTLPAAGEGATQRDRLAGHAAMAACAGCHRLIDPIGLSFEHYDALGVYRNIEHESGAAIDASVSVSLGDAELDGNYASILELAPKIAQSGRFFGCMSQQWLTFLLGRALRESDTPLLEQVASRLRQSEGRVDQLVLDLVLSRQFRSKALLENAQ
jgi:hypothetical protein